MPIPTLLKQHAEDASTKWWQRYGAVRQFDTHLQWLAELDGMIVAHCDGLREAGDEGLLTVRNAYENSFSRKAADVRGDSFTLVALQAEHDSESALQNCAGNTHLRDAVDDFLSWSNCDQAKQVILNWSQDTTHPMHTNAVSYLHIHRFDGGDGLLQALFKSTTDTVCVVLDAIAHCGRVDLLEHVLQLLDSPQLPDDSPIQFSAARCALLLGSTKRAIESLLKFSASDTPLALKACQLLSFALTPEQFNVVLHNPNKAMAIRCVGWHGNPVHVPWLIQQMQEPTLRSLASESFRQIVGLSPDTAVKKFQPHGSKQKITATLTDALVQWWSERKRDFEQGTAYLCGRVVSLENLRHLLLTAQQGDREVAALRHLLMLPTNMLFPTAAKVDLQWQFAANMAHALTPQKDRP